MKKIVKLSALFLAIILLSGCGKEFVGTPYNYDNKQSTNDKTEPSKNKIHKLGETFTFDGLEFTFDSNYSFVTLKNRYSEHNGASVIKLGVKVKNVSDEKNKLNMFYYDLFGSQGTELDGVSTYFDDNIDFAGDLKPTASYYKYFYILYDGDGHYSIDFDNWSETTTVEFDIKK